MDCLVSVIVPVHNTVEYLPRCIDSIRNQSLKDIEIILVENQSNDGSPHCVMNICLLILV